MPFSNPRANFRVKAADTEEKEKKPRDREEKLIAWEEFRSAPAEEDEKYLSFWQRHGLDEDEDEDGEGGEDDDTTAPKRRKRRPRPSSVSKLFPRQRRRRCVDAHCLLFFAALLAVWIYVGVFGFMGGDMRRLRNPTASDGQICGAGDMKDRNFLLFFNILACSQSDWSYPFNESCLTKQICVRRCSEVNFSPLRELELSGDDEASRARVKEVMAPFCETEDLSNRTVQHLVEEKICPPWIFVSTPILGNCLPMVLFEHKEEDVDGSTTAAPTTTEPTTTTTTTKRGAPRGSPRSAENEEEILYGSVAYRRPVSKYNLSREHVLRADRDNSTVTKEGLLNAGQVAAHAIGISSWEEKLLFDLRTSVDLFLACGAAFATAASLLWMVLLSYWATLVVWLTVATLEVCLASSAWFCYNLYRELRHSGVDFKFDMFANKSLSDFFREIYNSRDFWIILGVVFSSLFTLAIVLTFFKRKKILTAAKIMRMTSGPLKGIWPVMLLPLFLIPIAVLLFLWFSLVSVRLQSTALPLFITDLSRCANLSACPRPDKSPCRGGYSTSVCASCPEAACIFAGYAMPLETKIYQGLNVAALVLFLLWLCGQAQLAAASAYVYWFWEVGKSPARLVWKACRFAARRVGTAAKGSLLIPLAFPLNYLLDKVRDLRQKRRRTRCQDLILFASIPCMVVYDYGLAFIKRYAYVMSPMYGRDFCGSGRIAHRLQERKRTNIEILTRQSNFIFCFSKVAITFGAAVLAKGLLESKKDYRHSVLLPKGAYFYTPLMVVVALSFFVSNLALETYETGVEALCLCFVQDKAMNSGSRERPFYMTEEVFKVLGKYMSPKEARTRERMEKRLRQERRRAAYLSGRSVQ